MTHMKRILAASVALVIAIALAMGALSIGHIPKAQAQSETCSTVINSEGEEVTARIAVNSGEKLTVTGSLDVTGCAIGVYAAPGAKVTISHADIFATELGTAFGVYNNGAQVTIEDSQIHGILGNGESCEDEGEDEGESCGGGGSGGMGGGGGGDRGYTGGMHGTGILFVGDGARGTISGTTVSNYGRRGISVSGSGARARIAGNTIIGQRGTASGQWRNGIWIANGATAAISGNVISENITGFSGKASSAIMVAGGASHNGMPNYTTGVQITGNTLLNNDTGVLLSNGPVLASVVTNNHVSGNTVRSTLFVPNNGAGIKDAGGNGDSITGNSIYGYGSKSLVVSEPPCINIVAQGNTIG